MQMMYQVIYDALVEVGRENEFVPQDYLNFFCLGNREVLDGDSSSLDTTEANAPNVIFPPPLLITSFFPSIFFIFNHH